MIRQAVADAFEDVDENRLLDAALEKRLRGAAIEDLDARGRARLVRALVGQGFSLSDVLRRLRS